MTKAEAGIGQGILLPTVANIPELPEDFDLTRRVTASRLIATIAEYADLPTDYTTVQDLDRVSPQNIDSGLIVGTAEAKKLREENEIQSVYGGVGFDAIHYMMINRSPKDLGGSSFSNSMKANKLKAPEDRLPTEEAIDVANRSAGHALENLVDTQERLIEGLSTQLTLLRGFRGAIKARGRAHYNGRNLDAIRKAVDTVILSDLEIAYINRVWEGQGVDLDDLKRAVQFNLYGRKGHNNTRMLLWGQYITMAGLHTRSQLAVVKTGLRKTRRELELFEPSLEKARQQVEDAQ
jgi:hypothetical protein